MPDPPSPEGAPAPELSVGAASAADWLRLLRPRQWTKNLLLLAALVFAQRLFDPLSVSLALVGFAVFCVASSSVYVVNDLLDAERDREHPEKRRRPIASGAIAPGAAAGAAVVLTLLALALGAAIGLRFALWTLAYILLNYFYSSVGKRVAILDVMLIASGFVIRAIAGAAAIDVPYSEWFILCTLFAAIFIAASKRKAELLSLEGDAARHRAVLGVYTRASLDAFTATAMAATLLTYSLYVLAERPGEEPDLLLLTVPFVIFGVFRYHLLVETSRLADRPEEVLLQDRPMQLCVLGFGVIAVCALYLGG